MAQQIGMGHHIDVNYMVHCEYLWATYATRGHASLDMPFILSTTNTTFDIFRDKIGPLPKVTELLTVKSRTETCIKMNGWTYCATQDKHEIKFCDCWQTGLCTVPINKLSHKERVRLNCNLIKVHWAK